MLLLLLLSGPLLSLSAQRNLGVDIDDSVYELLDSASMKGYITDLSHYRPYSADQVYRYLEQIGEVSTLDEAERKVLDREMERFLGIVSVFEPDTKFIDFLKDGTVLLSGDENLPLVLRLEFDLKNRLEFFSQNPYLFNVMRLYLEGNITPYFSYQAMAGTGMTLIKTNAFAPYTYRLETDGQAISGGNIQNGEVSFDGSSPSLALQVGGKVAASFFNGRVRTSLGYTKRNIGISNTSLIYSGQAGPLLGWDLSIRPFKWAGLNFMVGGLNGIDDSTSTSKAMFTAQQFEFFLTQYFYIGVTMSSVWIKRLEPYYMMPFMPVAFGQSLLGDYDNLAIQGTMALKLPYVTIYGVGFADEVQPSDLAGLFSSLTQQFAFQAGIKVLIPKLPFTTFQFQYTKIEPYTYTHYAQRAFQGSAKAHGTINISWMNNGANLGYYLEPNSDEFLFKIESQPFPGWHFALGYKHIRHGDGNRMLGQVEGRSNALFENTVNKTQTTAGVSTNTNGNTAEDQIYTGIYSGAEWYFSKDDSGGSKRPSKDFLNDGVYEYIHVISLDVGYRFRQLPIEIVGHFMFSRNDGPVYNGIKGNEEIRLAVGFDFRFYGKSRR
ncbi:hypothetical protein P0082_06485 [Candidatus Haliotispira prima]|uniref:Capsule assembly protein Wzi n=1 Tax=Candidatus Haliotispira prima TaxID=3034016 RepID=A0ABY8MFY4_9SPIO|nr:hypothetical protein P0082_06485 [Candidatus Haliotispira prima]